MDRIAGQQKTMRQACSGDRGRRAEMKNWMDRHRPDAVQRARSAHARPAQGQCPRRGPVRLRTSRYRARCRAWPSDDASDALREKWTVPRRALRQRAGRESRAGRVSASLLETSCPHVRKTEIRRDDGTQPDLRASSREIGTRCLPDRIQKKFPVYCVSWVAAFPASSPEKVQC